MPYQTRKQAIQKDINVINSAISRGMTSVDGIYCTCTFAYNLAEKHFQDGCEFCSFRNAYGICYRNATFKEATNTFTSVDSKHLIRLKEMLERLL